MSVEPEAFQPQAIPPAPNPWKFVPILYVLQAIPVTIISDLSSVFYQDLGVPEQAILTWTSILALPWSLQFLLGPLVDLSAKKRRWIVSGQFLLTICLAIAPFLILPGQKAFVASLIFLGAAGFVSAMTNIATDGFYLLALPRDKQSSFAGLQSACFKAGRLICLAFVPFIAGYLMRFNPVHVETKGNLYFAVESDDKSHPSLIKTADLHLDQGGLVTEQGKKLLDDAGKPVTVPGISNAFNIQNGNLEIGNDHVHLGLYRMGTGIGTRPEESAAERTAFPTGKAGDTFAGGAATRAIAAPIAWFFSLLAIALLYGVLMFTANRLTPEVSQDVEPTESQRGQFRGNLQRTVAILGFYAAAYFAVSAVWKLIANTMSGLFSGWALPKETKVFGQVIENLSGVTVEIIQFGLCLPIAIGLVLYLRRSLKGTDMGEAFSSFFRQSGIIPILLFMTFYRFSEAMVSGVSRVFLKADLVKGGLALNNIQFGLVKGTIGMIGIILGGVVGGVLASKVGLKKGFWLIAVLMHLPILFYVYAALFQPSSMIAISVVEFIDQFGYGLGLTAYFVYIMSIAQRGNHRTAHYAIGTGLGSTFIAIAGIIGAVILGATSYKVTFSAALLFAIPGLLTLMFIPHDEERAAEVAEAKEG